MGRSLGIVAGLVAYTLTDRATWANFRDRHILDVVFSGDPALRNVYSSLLVNPAKGAQIKAQDAKVWHEWLTSDEGQSGIAAYRIGEEQPFQPIRSKPRSHVQQRSMSGCLRLRQILLRPLGAARQHREPPVPPIFQIPDQE